MAVEHRGEDIETVGTCLFRCALKGRREMGDKLEDGSLFGRQILQQGPVVSGSCRGSGEKLKRQERRPLPVLVLEKARVGSRAQGSGWPSSSPLTCVYSAVEWGQ